MPRKLLDFNASISDVKQVNPLFSTCKVRVLYTGRNRNMSIISKDAVEKALPTLKNIPIVGEFSEASNDYKGHGGAIDLDSYKFIHTTKPYGVVPESATYEWEDVKGADGSTRQYLTIHGCYLWTGRYEEAFSVVENGKGQSMEIEVTDGRWDESQEAYQIDNFIFSALCILGDDTEPAFEDANITAYSLDKDSFKQEFTTMLSELKTSLSEKEVNGMLKELLAKYSLTVEELTAKGINFNEISEDELEAKIVEAFEIEVEKEEVEAVETEVEVEDKLADVELETEVEVEAVETEVVETEVEEVEVEAEVEVTDAEVVEDVEVEAVVETVDVEALQSKITELEGQVESQNLELETLREFKLNIEKADHETKAQKLFNDFQLTGEDVDGLDVHKFSLEEIEEKCYAILGRKMATKKNFSKQEDKTIRIEIKNEEKENEYKPYGNLFEKYNK